jgi:hypothetical protein
VIVLDQTAPAINFETLALNTEWYDAIDFSYSSGDTDIDESSIVWTNNINSTTST